MCVVINLDDHHLWPWHAVVRCSGRDPAPSGRVSLSLSKRTKSSLQQGSFRAGLYHLLICAKTRKGSHGRRCLRDPARWARCIPPPPPSITRVKWRLSDIVASCRLEVMPVMFHLTAGSHSVLLISSCDTTVAPRRHRC